MASISKDAKGNRTIQFADTSGKRKILYLGKMPAKTVQAIKVKVEAIIVSKIALQPIDIETAKWIGSLDAKMTKKLTGVGLIEGKPDPESQRGPDWNTVWGFADDYVERKKKDVKESTATFIGHTVRNLKAKFTKEMLLKDFTEGDADDFQSYLRNDAGLSPATANRRCSLARSIFRDAKRRRRIPENPFEHIKTGSTANEKRKFFVSREVIQQVMDACPNAQWRCLVALSRFGGLRVPSEPFLLKLEDIDWDQERFIVTSPKTEHHEGKDTRVVPLFPELRPYIEEVFDAAPAGTVWLLFTLRHGRSDDGNWRNVNMGTLFQKLLRRAKIQPWPRIWHNLRASRDTELSDEFPDHVVSAWMGNSERIGTVHYKMVTDEHFAAATKKRCKIPMQSAAGLSSPESTRGDETQQKKPDSEGNASESGSDEWAMRDSIPSECYGENVSFVKTDVKNDAKLRKIIEAWGQLTRTQKRAILKIVDQAAVGPSK